MQKILLRTAKLASLLRVQTRAEKNMSLQDLLLVTCNLWRSPRRSLRFVFVKIIHVTMFSWNFQLVEKARCCGSTNNHKQPKKVSS